MKTNTQKTAQLGDLIAAAYDAAADYYTDPEDVSRAVTQVVLHVMRPAHPEYSARAWELPTRRQMRHAHHA